MAHQLKDPQIDLFDFESSLPMFKRFVEFVPDGVIGVRETGLIAFANVHAEDIFGYERDALLGRPMEILVPARFRGAHSRHTAEYFDDPRMRPMGTGPELYGLHSDGSEFRVEISLSTIQSARGTFVLSVIRDVAEQIDAKRTRPHSITAPAPTSIDPADPVAQILKEADFLASRLTNRPDLHESIDRLRDAAIQAANLTDTDTDTLAAHRLPRSVTE